MNPVEVPADALVMLVGAAASGKSTWARTCFRETQIVSSDHCRALVSDDPEDQSANREAFGVFYRILSARAALRRLSVADSTALQAFSRARMREISARFGVPIHAVVFPVPLPVLLERNAQRARRVPPPIVERHALELDALVAGGVLETEGYDGLHYLPEPRPVRVLRPVLA